MRYSSIAIGMALLALTRVPAAEPDNTKLASQAHQILKAHCYRCHGQDGVFEGGMNYILDAAKLVSHKKIIPGSPDESKLYQRIAKGSMPPADQTDRPSANEKEILRNWIAAGAPAMVSAAAPRTMIKRADLERWMLSDLETMDRRTRRFIRYFSLAHLYNLGLDDDELQSYRNALSKLANSLSWQRRISVPVAVDPNKTLLRIDLRWYSWDANLWNRVLNEYPYGVLDDGVTTRAVMVGTATRLPLVRADWFIATACRPPLYFDLLQLPASLTELERQLRVDAAADIQQERVARLGFNGSGVSKNNRILERHESIHGVYWRTYDFEAVPQNLVERGGLLPDQRNIFAYPLGPAGVAPRDPFLHAGGEAIFSLPNGLHGYMIVNAVNNRIDKGATQIVSDPKRPDRAVETGVSCMSCHLTGINPKTDQVRDSLAKNEKQFSRSDAELIRALYPPEEKMTKLMSEDMEAYRKAIEQTGTKIGKTEPVSTLTLRYEADIDLPTAAAEVGLSSDEFRRQIAASNSLARNLGALLASGGTVSRQVFVQTFGDLVRDLGLGTLFRANSNSGSLPDNTGDLDPLEGSPSQANAMAFTHDGRLAVIAGADRSFRLWDVQAQREIRHFVGHTASVWSVALSPDERFALSGSMDGTMRLWDIATGQELKRFDGHLSLVAAVAFSPVGKQVASAGYDGSIVTWTIDGQHLQRSNQTPPRFIQCLQFLPDGDHLLTAFDSGLYRKKINGGTSSEAIFSGSAITSIAISPNGKLAAYGTDNGTIAILSLASYEIIREFANPTPSPVRDVCFAPSGKAILSAGADGIVRLWSIADGKQVAEFKKHSDVVVNVAFINGGRQSLSGSRDSAIKTWDLARFASLVRAPDSSNGSSTTPPSHSDEISSLKESAVIPIGGSPSNLVLSPNRKWLFCTDRDAGKLIQIATSTLKQTRTWSLPKHCERLSLTSDGKSLWTVAAKQDQSELIEIDPISLSIRQRTPLDLSAYDITASSDFVFVSGKSGGWSDVTIVDPKRQAIAGRWGGIWTRSIIQTTSDGSRLYVSSQGVTPGKVEGFAIPVKLDQKPVPITITSKLTAAVGGPFIITPDDRFAIFRTGATLRISPNREDDLQPSAKLPRHLACAADPARGVLLVLAEDGLSVQRFSYPDLISQATYHLTIPAFDLAFDGQNAKLYLGANDARSSSQVHARGRGDIRVYDLKDELAPKK